MDKKRKIKNNKSILVEWEEQIETFPKLSIESARSLYLEAMHKEAEQEKNSLLNEVIQGTLYVVVNFIKNNKLRLVKTTGYDIGDIINTCNELWIKEIYGGALLDADAYSRILDSTFCTKMVSILNETDFTPTEVTLFNAYDFVNILYEYIEYEKQNGEASFRDFCRVIAKHYDMDEECYYPRVWSRINDFKLSDSDLGQQTYELFQNIVDALKDRNGNIELTKTKIDNFKSLFIEVGLQRFRVNMSRVSEKDFSEALTKDIVLHDFVNDVFEYGELDDRKKDLLVRSFGLCGCEKQECKEIANIYRISEARAYQLRNKALKSLRVNPKILKYRQFYKEQL